jgi:tetratricopeptide (TPR) repeat protein
MASENADFLNAQGVLRYRAGDSAGAMALIGRAVALAPENAEYHFNLGLARLRAGAIEAAAGCFRHAALLRPDWPEAQYDLANALRLLGQFEDAARHYRQALRLRPRYVQAEVNLANLLRDMGKPDQAEAAYRRALRVNPDLAEAHNNLGTLLAGKRQPDAARDHFAQALRLRPDFTEAMINLADVAGQTGEAAALLDRAAGLRATNAVLWERAGALHLALKSYGRAAAAYRSARAVDPARRSASFGLADALRAQRDFAGAEAILRNMAATHPGDWQPIHHLGNILRDQGRFAEAEAAYRAALRLADLPIIHTHLGAVLRDLNRVAEARAALETALAAQPDLEEARYNLAITRLTAGELAEGFAGYDARFAMIRPVPLASPAWLGEPVGNRTLLVVAEQGFGDTIQFVRYLPALLARGARVILRLPPGLITLIRTLPRPSGTRLEIVGADKPTPRHDLHVYLMSLPHRLGLAAEPCPIVPPYLTADPDKEAAWRARLAALPGLRVGLAWAGNPGFYADHLRSLPPGLLRRLQTDGVSLVCLQKDRPIPPGLDALDAAADLQDWSDTAALISALDLVVSVDTAVVHVAGALGRPVWLLNRFDTCWRWGTDTGTCIWYPTLTQFRQPAPGDWETPVAQAQAAFCAGMINRA